jgi:hypothetical protein
VVLWTLLGSLSVCFSDGNPQLSQSPLGFPLYFRQMGLYTGLIFVYANIRYVSRSSYSLKSSPMSYGQVTLPSFNCFQHFVAFVYHRD